VKLPSLSGREFVRVLERAGWQVRRRRGGHIILTKPGVPYNLAVPDHKTLKAGTLRSLIRKAGLERDEFLRLLQSL